MRNTFESWYRANIDPNATLHSIANRDEKGAFLDARYVDNNTELAWQVWQGCSGEIKRRLKGQFPTIYIQYKD